MEKRMLSRFSGWLQGNKEEKGFDRRTEITHPEELPVVRMILKAGIRLVRALVSWTLLQCFLPQNYKCLRLRDADSHWIPTPDGWRASGHCGLHSEFPAFLQFKPHALFMWIFFSCRHFTLLAAEGSFPKLPWIFLVCLFYSYGSIIGPSLPEKSWNLPWRHQME